MYLDKSTIFVGIAVAVIVIEWLRHRAFQNGRLAGIREAVIDVSRSCSSHYERQDEPLPENVDKALVYMKNILKRGRGLTGKIDLYLTGAGMLGDAMGDAAYQKGFDAGRRWTEPSEGEKRVDMTEREIRDLSYLADVGFHHVIEGGARHRFPERCRRRACVQRHPSPRKPIAAGHRRRPLRVLMESTDIDLGEMAD